MKVNVCAACHSKDIETTDTEMRCAACGATGPFLLLDEKAASEMKPRVPALGKPARPARLPYKWTLITVAVALVLLALVYALR